MQNSPRLDTLIRLAGAVGIEPSALIPSIRWEPPRPLGGGVYEEGPEADTIVGSD